MPAAAAVLAVQHMAVLWREAAAGRGMRAQAA